MTSDNELQELLHKATRVKEVILNTKARHKILVQEIKGKRNKLMIDMTLEIDGSVAQGKIEREIDSLDQREFKLHYDMKKTLSTADVEINEIIGDITRRFGPNSDSNRTPGDTQDYERGATK